MEETMKLFRKLKEKHDAVLLFRNGDFYEAYQEDAEAVHAACGYRMRDEGEIKVTSFANRELDVALPMLIRVCRVAICEKPISEARKEEHATGQATLQRGEESRSNAKFGENNYGK